MIWYLQRMGSKNVDAQLLASQPTMPPGIMKQMASLGATSAQLPAGADMNSQQTMTSQERAISAKNAAEQNMVEGFQAAETTDTIDKIATCACDGTPEVNYAVDAYGKDISSYNQWMKNQGVSADVQKNHSDWLADRNQVSHGGGSYYTGRTYSVDSHDSYDPIPWIGLRRPEYVPVGNPDQVPDVDYELYKGNRQFCFRT